MADKRKGKQKKVDDEEEKPTKEEYAVAKYLRFGLPNKDGKLHGMEVKCFMGNAAVDKLMESKWSAEKNTKDPLFLNRASCVAYLVRLLEKGMFHRAEREKRKKDKDKTSKDKPKKKKVESAEEEDVKERKGKKDKKSQQKDKDAENEAEEGEKKDSEKKEKKEKKQKIYKLLMPDQQFFEDGNEIYVWIYDPINAKTFIIGLLMVLGAISLCMFPLWPEVVRIGVYYLSLCAAGFVGFILSLVVLRLILFCCIWVLTLGRHHFWLLPNLTEDVGFFDSFRPLYKYDYVAPEEASKDKDGKKSKKKDSEKSASTKKKSAKSSDKEDSDEFEVIKKEDIEDTEREDDVEDTEKDDDDLNENTEDNLDDDDEDYDEEDDNNVDSTEDEIPEPKKTK